MAFPKLILSNGVKCNILDWEDQELHQFLRRYDFLTMDDDGSIYATKDALHLPILDPDNEDDDEVLIWILKCQDHIQEGELLDGMREIDHVGDIAVSGFIKSKAKCLTSLTAMSNRAHKRALEAGYKDCKLVRI